MSDPLHFAVPFRFVRARAGGGLAAATNPEGSTEEIADCVEMALRTVQGQRTSLPTFGRPDSLEFANDPAVVAAGLAVTIDDAEPRARGVVDGEHDPRDPGAMRIQAMFSLTYIEEAGQ
jgi:hypothetical protein